MLHVIRNFSFTPTAFHNKAQGRPELGEGRTLGKRKEPVQTPKGFYKLHQIAISKPLVEPHSGFIRHLMNSFTQGALTLFATLGFVVKRLRRKDNNIFRLFYRHGRQTYNAPYSLLPNS